MTDAKYVLCRWKERLWPAKVLARTEMSTTKKKKGFFLNVQILSLDKKVRVKSTEAKILRKSHIEDIAALLASQNKVSAKPVEELTYRRSLRVALDILNEKTHSHQENSSREERTAVSAGEKHMELASSLCDHNASSLLHEGVLGSSGPERRERVPQKLSGSSTSENEIKCQMDHKKGIGESESPLTLVVSAGGGSRDQSKSRIHLKNGTTLSESEGETDSPAVLNSPSASTEQGLCTKGRHSVLPSGSPTVHLAYPDVQGPPDHQSSEESMEFEPVNSILEEEEEEEPPRILLYHEPSSFEVGMLVWLKYQKYPFWPAVVKNVKRREKKASVLFIEGHMDPKGRGITVPLKRLKHFDCKEKQALLNEAKEDFDQAIGWCVSLITDYRVRLGCGSFSGSFLEYYAANISYPVRKSIQQDVLGTRFPRLCHEDPEMPMVGSPWGRRQPCRKVLPDRSRAARDRANQKLVEYIVKARGAENHLRAILKNKKPSRWLKTFLNSGQYVTCVETYLEDEEQLDMVVKYLQGVYQETGSRMLTQINGDRIRFILDVLLPEAIICAISAVDAVDYKTAEEKYIKGPLLSYREKEIFDNQLLEERNQRC
ncbi:PWWP domain-containing DNA repair factor 3A isoform X1 [Eptesicus fuscus]|uniref:PWWP domain-containing DNA repair factor 3A isoform X1 n=2 Tax=Eptesicus fuscus TaxID=29078 RepID=UPI002403C036|nr:PWWP domain-containing DNA repair factor 3A isoform X1 [Eptesicus fuscus]XP_054573546.1 PWWP domain-containing DNA repair factor 3A isoform X1 [Eptesicus fuscus]XP_054573547.1 PWWP domain-containing DNA repair factor 3A isoform X1 [Eptesicus fuscus]